MIEIVNKIKKVQRGVFCILRSVEKGDHGNYLVVSPYYNQWQVTTKDSISVGKKKWRRKYFPDEEDTGAFIMLFGVFGKEKGLRVSAARFATPKEIGIHKKEQQSKKQK